MYKLLDIYREEYKDGRYSGHIVYLNIDQPIDVELPIGVWNKPIIVSSLIRSKYSQDSVEALVNNHLLLLAEWQDKIFNGENPGKLVDPEYDELQEWRKLCKQWADEALEKFPE